MSQASFGSRQSFWAMQDQARSQTTRLVLIFCIVFLLSTIATIFVFRISLAFLSLEGSDLEFTHKVLTYKFPHWIDFAALGLSAAVIVVGSLIKHTQLQAGGQFIAHMLGGRLVTRENADLEQRRLLNVVEEMAIASGIPVPPVYVLEGEGSINAFAAGLNPSDAILGFSNGSIYKLSRDELQGVVAHEFSHIFNGDMRLNMRLLVLVAGLESLTHVGQFLAETDLRGRRVPLGKDNANPIAFLAIGLMIIGGLGSFMARFIRAAVSRQREYLADATAVQYTRNPDGIGQALLKALIEGASIKSLFSKEVAHFFLADCTKKLDSSSHPPLEDRIKRLSPGLLARRKDFEAGFRQEVTLVARKGESPYRNESTLQAIGTAALAGIGEAVIQEITKPPTTGASTFLAKAKILAALSVETFHPEDPLNKRHGSKDAASTEIAEATAKALKAFTDNEKFLSSCHQEIVDMNRLPYSEALEERSKCLLIYTPVLRILPKEKRLKFFTLAKAIAHSNAHVSAFEGAALCVLRKALAIQLKNRSGMDLSMAASLVLSSIANQMNHPIEADKALQAGRRQLFSGGLTLPTGFQVSLVSPATITGEQIDEAFAVLDSQSTKFRRRFLQALEQVAMFDRKMTVGEAELIRSIGLAFDLPTPDIHELQEDPASN